VSTADCQLFSTNYFLTNHLLPSTQLLQLLPTANCQLISANYLFPNCQLKAVNYLLTCQLSFNLHPAFAVTANCQLKAVNYLLTCPLSFNYLLTLNRSFPASLFLASLSSCQLESFLV